MMYEQHYGSENYKGFKLHVTEERKDGIFGDECTWFADVLDEDGDIIHTERSTLSGVQAFDKAKAYVDKFVDYED